MQVISNQNKIGLNKKEQVLFILTLYGARRHEPITNLLKGNLIWPCYSSHYTHQSLQEHALSELSSLDFDYLKKANFTMSMWLWSSKRTVSILYHLQQQQTIQVFPEKSLCFPLIGQTWITCTPLGLLPQGLHELIIIIQYVYELYTVYTLSFQPEHGINWVI